VNLERAHPAFLTTLVVLVSVKKNWRVILEKEMHILFLWINALLTTFSQKDRTVNEFNLTDRIS